MRKIIMVIAFLLFAINANAETINIVWDASTSTDVTGHKFYLRNIATPTIVQLVGTAGKVTSTSLTIPTIIGSDQFQLVATAFDGAGNESVYSDPAVDAGTNIVHIFKDNVPPAKPTNLRIP